MEPFSIERITAVTDDALEAAVRLSTLLGSSNQVQLTKGYLEQMTDNPDNYWLMARELGTKSNNYIGMASLAIMRMPTNVRSSLENVVVDQSARGMGVGTALCLAAKQIADQQMVNTLRAAAGKDNEASRSMLKRAGFVIDAELDYLELSIQDGPRI
jgi:ribosomal protein S18 acetylase RimI-like enzyme